MRGKGKALTNFPRALPPPDSDMAEQILKDPYNFDFLTVTATAREREIERGLLTHLRDLLLETGPRLLLRRESGARDRGRADLLHRSPVLPCPPAPIFCFRAEGGAFQPEHAGKLGFYLAAVNRTMRTPIEGPSIGVLLCESRSGPMVEFALENTNQPIGVSTYQVTRELPAPMQEELPSVEDLQEVVNKLRSEMETLRKEPSDEE